MTDTTDRTEKERGRLGWKTRLLICGPILLLGAVTTGHIFSTEPAATRTGATRESAMLVDVADVASGTFQPTKLSPPSIAGTGAGWSPWAWMWSPSGRPPGC